MFLISTVLNISIIVYNDGISVMTDGELIALFNVNRSERGLVNWMGD